MTATRDEQPATRGAAPTDSLVAQTVRLDHEPDLVAVAGDTGRLWVRDGWGVAGVGEALRITMPGGLGAEDAAGAVTAALAAIERHDPLGLPGTGPVALGALPFDPAAPAEVVVPAVIVGVGHGTAWATSVAAERRTPSWPEAASMPSRTAAGPDEFRLLSTHPHAHWIDLVRRAVAAIAEGDFEKVVLAREVTVEANRPFSLPDVMARLRSLHPSCMVFSIDGFVGASPELLVGRAGDAVRSHPHAGTVARSGDADADRRASTAMLASGKERAEHRVVVDAVAAALREHCDALDVPEEPSIVSLRNVAHLATLLQGRVRPAGGAGGAGASALELAAALHPTPAVGGNPRDAALTFVRESEGIDRGRYAGPVGWVDADGNGEWAVGIRSADITGSTARMLAGVGVVADSDPVAELTETQLKLQAMLAALVRP